MCDAINWLHSQDTKLIVQNSRANQKKFYLQYLDIVFSLSVATEKLLITL